MGGRRVLGWMGSVRYSKLIMSSMRGREVRSNLLPNLTSSDRAWRSRTVCWFLLSVGRDQREHSLIAVRLVSPRLSTYKPRARGKTANEAR